MIFEYFEQLLATYMMMGCAPISLVEPLDRSPGHAPGGMEKDKLLLGAVGNGFYSALHPAPHRITVPQPHNKNTVRLYK
jgi:hypothetical protein